MHTINFFRLTLQLWWIFFSKTDCSKTVTPLKLCRLTYLVRIQLQKASYIPKTSHPSYLQSYFQKKEYGPCWKKRKFNKQTLSNLEQSIDCTQFFLWRVFIYVGKGKQLPKTWLNLESDSVFEDKSFWVHSSATILFNHNRSHKFNILWSELNTMLTDSAIPVKYRFMHK